MTDQDKARGALSEWYASKNIHAFVEPAGRRGTNIFLFHVTTPKDRDGITQPVKISSKGNPIVGTPARRLVVSGALSPTRRRPVGDPIIRKTHLAPRDLVSTGWTGTDEELADRGEGDGGR